MSVDAGRKGGASAAPAAGAMTDKERVDVLLSLIATAYERQDRLADVAWKLRLSVWTAFGVAAGFVINAEKWKPTWVECAIGCSLALGIVAVVVFLWGPFSYLRTTRWSRVAAHWEGELEKLVALDLPDYLRMKTWLRSAGGFAANDPLQSWYKQRVYLSHALITLFFGSLLMMALLSKVS